MQRTDTVNNQVERIQERMSQEQPKPENKNSMAYKLGYSKPLIFVVATGILVTFFVGVVVNNLQAGLVTGVGCMFTVAVGSLLTKGRK